MNAIKIKRAARLAKIGPCPDSFQAVIETIGPEVVAALSARQIADLADRIWASWQTTKAIHERDILAEGAIFNGDKLLELFSGRAPVTTN
jgi:hypothetical protein